MRRVVLSVTAGIVLAMASAAGALAAPAERFTEPLILVSPDFELGLVLFVNTDRDTICTAEQVAFEEALLAWIEGGEVGDPPVDPGFPAGFEMVSFLVKETGKGALVQHILGSGLPSEVWQMDPDAPGIGPCTDTDDVLTRVGTGSARFRANDNDVFGSGTRGNAFGDRGIINLVDDEGNALRYTWRFHTNSRCHLDEDQGPVCLVEGTALT